MKNCLIAIMLLFLPSVVMAQLTERVVSREGKQLKSNKYDTLSNYPTLWSEYVGQDIIFLPLNHEIVNLNVMYDCFFTNIECTHYYKDMIDKNAKVIENKKFSVFGYDIVVSDGFLGDPGLIFNLVSEEGLVLFWKIPYMTYGGSVSNNFADRINSNNVTLRLPIVVSSFIERMKTYVGQKFYACDSIKSDSFRKQNTRIVDLTSGRDVDIVMGGEFECVDLTLMASGELYKQPFFIFKDSIDREIAVSFMDVAGTVDPPTKRLSIKDFISEKDLAEKLKLQAINEKAQKELEDTRLKELIDVYGEENGTLIAERQVKIGMTEQMCKDALGKPEMTNKIVKEGIEYQIWEYNIGTFNRVSLYFENGKLNMIKE